MIQKPPRLATWVLKAFGGGRAKEALAGDLIEEWRHGHSRTWYWKQVLVAVGIGFCTEIWAHRVIAARAIATGWLASYAIGYVWSRTLIGPYYDFVRDHVSAGNRIFGIQFASVILGLPLWVAFGALTGWIIARLHRPYQAVMVTAYLGSVWLWKAPWLCTLAADALGHPRYIESLIASLLSLAIATASTLMGGLWEGSRPVAFLNRAKI